MLLRRPKPAEQECEQGGCAHDGGDSAKRYQREDDLPYEVLQPSLAPGVPHRPNGTVLGDYAVEENKTHATADVQEQQPNDGNEDHGKNDQRDQQRWVNVRHGQEILVLRGVQVMAMKIAATAGT